MWREAGKRVEVHLRCKIQSKASSSRMINENKAAQEHSDNPPHSAAVKNCENFCDKGQ